MIEKISNMRDELNNDINHLEEELFLYTNTSKWIDWLNKMYLEIDSDLDYPLEKKKE